MCYTIHPLTCCNWNLHTPWRNPLQKYRTSTSTKQFIEVYRRISKSAGKHTLQPPTRHSRCPSRREKHALQTFFDNEVIAQILYNKIKHLFDVPFEISMKLIWNRLMQLCFARADAKPESLYPCTTIQEDIANPQYRRRKFNNILTHIQLTNEACKVVVLEILGKDFACKRSLIVDQESGSILRE